MQHSHARPRDSDEKLQSYSKSFEIAPFGPACVSYYAVSIALYIAMSILDMKMSSYNINYSEKCYYYNRKRRRFLTDFILFIDAITYSDVLALF